MERSEYEVMAAVELRHWWYGGMRAVSAAMLDRAYKGRHDLQILDAGCGTGGDALFLQRYGRVIGLDYAAPATTLGADRIPGRIGRGSVLDLPFATGSFDLVTSFDVLYHRGVPDERTALREAHRVLRPAGRLLIRLPAYEWLRSRHDRQVHTRRRYTSGEVRRLLAQSGFQIEQISYVLSLLFPLSAALRLLERFTPDRGDDSAMELPSPLVNTALRLPMAFESAWLSFGGSFPFGLSVMAIARRTAEPAASQSAAAQHALTPQKMV